MNNTLSKVIASGLLLSTLAGCSQIEMVKGTQTAVASQTDRANEMMKRASVTENPFRANGPLTTSDDVWVGAKRVKLDLTSSTYPQKLRDPFSIGSPTPLSLQDIAEQISAARGLQVNITQDALAVIPQGRAGLIKVSFNNVPLSSFLDTVTSKFGLVWKYDRDTIVISYLESRTWTIRAIPAKSTLRTSVTASAQSSGTSAAASGTSTSASGGTSDATSLNSNTGSGVTSASTASSTTSGTGQQTSTVDAAMNTWTDIEESVKSMISPKGKYYASRSTNTLIVTDTKEVLDRVDSYVQTQNRQMTRQVLMAVKVYSVSLSAQAQNGVDLSLVYAASGGSLTGLNPFTGAAGAMGSVTAAILDSSSKWNGSKLILRALEKQGDVSLVTSSNVTTLNNNPVPVQVGSQIGYLASVSTTTITNGGTTTSLTPGTISTGFNMNLLPSLYPDGKMLLQYTIGLTDLSQIKDLTSGGSSIQLPEVNTRNFMQQVSLRSGQTLVLSGFERVTDSINKGGILKDNPLLGNRDAKRTREVFVVEITPIVIEDDN